MFLINRAAIPIDSIPSMVSQQLFKNWLSEGDLNRKPEPKDWAVLLQSYITLELTDGELSPEALKNKFDEYNELIEIVLDDNIYKAKCYLKNNFKPGVLFNLGSVNEVGGTAVYEILEKKDDHET